MSAKKSKQLKRKVLNEGSYGIIYQTREDELNDEVVKEFDETDTSFREIEALQGIDHPNVISLIGVDTTMPGKHRLRFELYDTDLQDYIATGAMDDPVGILLQIAKGLDAIHKAGFLHRDLKTANVLIGMEDENAVICDFGQACRHSARVRRHTLDAICTFASRAPEIELDRDPCYGPAVDVYSFGIIMFEIYHGRGPFCDISMAEERVYARRLIAFYNALQTKSKRKLQEVFGEWKFDHKMEHLWRRCIARDPKKRIGVPEICSVLEEYSQNTHNKKQKTEE